MLFYVLNIINNYARVTQDIFAWLLKINCAGEWRKVVLTESPAEKLRSANLIIVKLKNVFWFIEKHKLPSKLQDFIIFSY